MKKKIALLLAVVMIISLMPMTVFAAPGVIDFDIPFLPEAERTLTDGQRVLEADGDPDVLSKIIDDGAVGSTVGAPALKVDAMTLAADGQMELTLSNAVWKFPDSGVTGSVNTADSSTGLVATTNSTTYFRVDGEFFIGTNYYDSANKIQHLYVIQKNTDAFATVKFYHYSRSAAIDHHSQVPTMTSLSYGGTGGTGYVIVRGIPDAGVLVLLPFANSLTASDLGESWNQPRVSVVGFDASGTSGSKTYNIFYSEKAKGTGTTTTYFSFAKSITAAFDGIQVFYFGSVPTNPTSSVLELGRISIQEREGKRINRFSVNVDSTFTVLPVHPIIDASTMTSNGSLGAGYVRRYVTLTAPEGYEWDYNNNLSAAIASGSYNLMYNPTGIFAAQPSRPAWLAVDQIRNKADKKSNELVLDLDFLATPNLAYVGVDNDADGIADGFTTTTFNDYDSSFEIAPGMLKLRKVADYVVVGGTIPVKVTITDYNNDHIVTKSIDVAKFTSTTNITLTSASTAPNVVGGAYPFIDNSAAVQSAEVGTPVGVAVYKENQDNLAGENTLKFTVEGATLVGAKINYVVNESTSEVTKFASDSREYIPAGRTAYRMNINSGAFGGGAYTGNDTVIARVNSDNTIEVEGLTKAIDGRLTVSITPYVVASVDTQAVDVTVTSKQTNKPTEWTTTTVTVGKAVVPATAVVSAQAKGSLGKDIKGGTITITEAQPGVINGSNYQPTTVNPVLTSNAIATKELTVSLQNDVFGTVRFMENADVKSSVSIVEGTGAGLSVSSARVDANGVLRVVFAGKSTVAAQIQIKDVPFAANRLTYNGDYSAYIGGSALAANYNDGVITNNGGAIKATITVPSFVNISDNNLGIGSVDTTVGKEVFAQIGVERVTNDDGTISTTGTVTDVATGTVTDLDPSPIITNGRTYMPLKAVAGLLGIGAESVTWDAATNTAMVEDGERAVYFTKNSDSYTVYNSGVATFKMDGAAFNKDGVMYIPVRYLAHGIFDGTAEEDASSTPNNRIINVYRAQ